jgi:hypothetical protein
MDATPLLLERPCRIGIADVIQLNFCERTTAARKVSADPDDDVKYAAVAGFPEHAA